MGYRVYLRAQDEGGKCMGWVRLWLRSVTKEKIRNKLKTKQISDNKFQLKQQNKFGLSQWKIVDCTRNLRRMSP